MKRILLTAALALGCAVGLYAQTTQPQWTPLFNGKDLSGWTQVHGASFVVTNGNLRLVTGMGWLRSDREYSDFVLEIQWRALSPGYDSGIFLRASAEGKPWPDKGWQVNLSRTALGGLVEGRRAVVPAETPPVPLNQWVTFRITARGSTVRLDVNGERAWEYDKMNVPKGFIGIQAEDKAFEFKEIRIRELRPGDSESSS